MLNKLMEIIKTFLSGLLIVGGGILGCTIIVYCINNYASYLLGFFFVLMIYVVGLLFRGNNG